MSAMHLRHPTATGAASAPGPATGGSADLPPSSLASPSPSPSSVASTPPLSPHAPRSARLYSSLRSRRRDRDRLREMRLADVDPGTSLSAVQQLAMIAGASENVVSACRQTVVSRMAFLSSTSSEAVSSHSSTSGFANHFGGEATPGDFMTRVEQFMQAPEVSCLLYEFAMQKHAPWNEHHRQPQTQTQTHTQTRHQLHRHLHLASGVASPQTLSPMASPSMGRRSTLDADRGGLLPLLSAPPSPAASAAASPSFQPRRASVARSRRVTAEDVASLTLSVRLSRAASPSGSESAGDQPPDWTLPNRLVFWHTPPHAHTTEATNEGGGNDGQENRGVAHVEDKKLSSSVMLPSSVSPPPPTPGAFLSPTNAALSQVSRDQLFIEPGVCVSSAAGDLHVYTGSDLSVVGSHVCVCITRRADDVDNDTDEHDEATATDREVAEWRRRVVCAVGPIGVLHSHGVSEPAIGSDPVAAPHTSLFHSLLAVSAAFRPALQLDDREESMTTSVTPDRIGAAASPSLRPVTGSAISAVKALRTSAAPHLHTHSPAQWSPASTTSVASASATLESWIGAVRATCSSLDGLVYLSGPDPPFELPPLQQLEDDDRVYTLCAQRTRIVHYEHTMSRWCEQLRAALSPPLLVDDSGDGPVGELACWRRRTDTLDHLCTQMESHHIRGLERVLGVYKSPCMSVWGRLRAECASLLHESRDNVRYLSALAGRCAALHVGTPREMRLAMPQMMRSISMVYQLAPFYRASEHLTALLVRTSRQLHSACTRFLAGPTAIWRRDRRAAITDIDDVIELVQAYRACYDEENDRLQREMPLGPSRFDVSTRVIFARLDALAARARRVREVVQTCAQFAQLEAIITDDGERDTCGGLPREGLDKLIAMSRRLQLAAGTFGTGSGTPRDTTRINNSSSSPIDATDEDEPIDLFTTRRESYHLFDVDSSAAASLLDADLTRFQRQVTQIEDAIMAFIRESFSHGSECRGIGIESDYTQRALQMMTRFRRLLAFGSEESESAAHSMHLGARHRLVVALRGMHEMILVEYTTDLHHLRAQYESEKESPPIARHMPRVAGAIAWSRLLLHRAQAPMKIIVHQRILESDDDHSAQPTPSSSIVPSTDPSHVSSLGAARRSRRVSDVSEAASSQHGATNRTVTVASKVIRLYNALTTALLQFEHIWYRAWLDGVAMSTALLRSPLLMQSTIEGEEPKEGRRFPTFTVHFDSDIFSLLRESKVLSRLGFVVPESVRDTAIMQAAQLRWHFDAMQRVVRRHTFLVQRLVSPTYAALVQPRLAGLLRLLTHGVTRLTWTSSGIDEFIADAERQLSDVEAVMERANDLLSTHIIRQLELVARTPLLVRPTGIVSEEEFLSASVGRCAALTPEVNARVRAIEMSCYELVDLLCVDYSPADRLSVRAARRGLIAHVHALQFQSVATMIEENLRRLKRNFIHITHAPASITIHHHDADGSTDSASSDAIRPLFAIELVLRDGHIQMVPSMSRIQKCVDRTAKSLLSVAGGVVVPGQVRPAATSDADSPSAHGLESYLPSVGRNRRILKVVFHLAGVFAGLQQKANAFLQRFESISFLCRPDKDDVMRHFLDAEPDLHEIDAKMELYETYHRQVSEVMHTKHEIDCLSLSFASLQQSLQAELMSWKHLFGRHLRSRAGRMCQTLSDRLRDGMDRLRQPVTSLESLASSTATVAALRCDETDFDCAFEPIVAIHEVMQAKGIDIGETDRAALKQARTEFDSLRTQLTSVSQHLISVHSSFKTEYLALIRRFHLDIADFQHRYETSGPFLNDLEPKLAVERLDAFQIEFDAHVTRWRFYEDLELLFFGSRHRGRLTRCECLVRVGREMHLGQQIYGLYKELTAFYAQFGQFRWSRVQTASSASLAPAAAAAAESPAEAGGTRTIDLNTIDVEMTKFSQRCAVLPRGMKEWHAYLEIKTMLNSWSECMPLLVKLASSAMQPRHWAQIRTLVDGGEVVDPKGDASPFADISTLRLFDLLSARFLSAALGIDDLLFHSSKEAEIEAKFENVKAIWTNETFHFDSTWRIANVLLESKHATHLVVKCGETRLTLQALLNSRHNSFLKEHLLTWVSRLARIDAVLEEWMRVQTMFVYISSVFSSAGGDVARQLPEEAKRFEEIDAKWAAAMAEVARQPDVVSVCASDDLVSLMPWMLSSLESCQKQLGVYLDRKRRSFPRFYFLSDAVLLEALAHGCEPTHMKEYLHALFDNIRRLEVRLDDGRDDEGELVDPNAANHSETSSPAYFITGMVSAELEKVRLHEPVPCSGPIESCLSRLERASQETVRLISVVVLQSCETNSTPSSSLPLVDSIKRFPAQLVLLAHQILWTRRSEEGLRRSQRDRDGMLTQLEAMGETLESLVSLTNNARLTDLVRQTVETLITVHVHQRDVYERLVKTKIRSLGDFDWQKQTRFYWEWEQAHCRVAITDVEFIYANEYMGSAGRLVITPLTDRCYITLAQSLGLGLGGSPVGPAGTGKTETVKDMGRTIGKFVVVFNCSDQLDHAQLAKIYKGLCQSGSWGCFDEFNRIALEVLSVAAQQIACVLQAIREFRSETTFTDGSNIKVDRTCAIFVTMNPGYAGRTELPENLKALFRSVAMMVPERALIIQVRLASSGFQRNAPLAKKLALLYQLCEQQLSHQRHYDFGLRNILSVLRVLGKAKRDAPATATEEEIVVRIVREMNVSKLIDADAILFRRLLEDLFPTVTHGDTDDPSERAKQFRSHVDDYCAQHHLVSHPPWTRKIGEIDQLLRVRHGLMLLGPACGKSTALDALRYVLDRLESPRTVRRMNPKSLTASQMFGRLDAHTQDWTEGVFSELWRQATQPTHTSRSDPDGPHSWLILDGPVDTLWIENLNSVLDDSRVLTLANGDRLAMPSGLRLIFEVENLVNASPATVSRAGMVFLGENTITWDVLAAAWITERTRTIDQLQCRRTLLPHEFTAASTELCPSDALLLSALLHRTVPVLLRWLRDSCVASVLRVADLQQMQTVLNYLEGLLAMRPAWTQEARASEAAEEAREEQEKLQMAKKEKKAKKSHRAPESHRATGPPSSAPTGQVTSPTMRQLRQAALERMVLFSLAWGVGGLLPVNERRRFHEMLQRDLRMRVPHTISVEGRKRTSDALPPMVRRREAGPGNSAVDSVSPSAGVSETIFDFFLDDRLRWCHWSTRVTRWRHLAQIDRFRRARMQAEDRVDIGHIDAVNAAVRALDQPNEGTDDESDFDGGDGQFDFESPTLLARWSTSEPLSPLISSRLLVPPFASIFVPTIDSVCAEFNLMLIAKQDRKSVLLIGEPGCAKTVTVQRFLERICAAGGSAADNDGTGLTSRRSGASDCAHKTFVFSSATTPQIFQTMLETCLVKRASGTYGPPPVAAGQQDDSVSSQGASSRSVGRITAPSHLRLFLDDINMPSINCWGDQVTNELVRQLVEYNEMYSLARPGDKMVIEDVTLMAAMSRPNGGRNDIPNRLKGRFHVAYLPPPSGASLDTIYSSVVRAYFNSERGFVPSVVSLSRCLPPMSRAVWARAHEVLLPTPARSHYAFNLRDLARIFEGVACHAHPRIVHDEPTLVNLWIAESKRAMSDKLVSHADVAWIDSEMRRSMDRHLPRHLLDDDRFQSAIFSDANPALQYFIHFRHGLEQEETTSNTKDGPTTHAGDQAHVINGNSHASMSSLAREQAASSHDVNRLNASKDALLHFASYEPAPHIEQLRSLLDAYLAQHNAQPRITQMHLVFFPDAIDHLLRLCRILRTANRGHALLVGLGGCGKQSLARLASFIVGARLVTPTLAQTSGEFVELLKSIYVDCGVRGVATTLLLTDADMREEATYFEYVNTMLTTGEVPGLFSRDEMTNLMFELRANLDRESELRERELALIEAQVQEAAGRAQHARASVRAAADETSASSAPVTVDYYREFLGRVRANLHLVLCFSPLHPRFRARLVQFPGLLSCTIDWFMPWSHEALVAVGETILADLQVPTSATSTSPSCSPATAPLSLPIRTALAQYMARAHAVAESCADDYWSAWRRRIYQTPKSFIHFAHSFCALYQTKLAALQAQYVRLTSGLAKLGQAERDILALESVLQVRQEELAVAGRNLQALVDEIASHQERARLKSEEMTQVRNRMHDAAVAIDRDRAAAEADLDAATPMFLAAQKALETITQKDLNLLKALLKPHNLIERVFDAILIMNRKEVRAIEMDERYGKATTGDAASSSSSSSDPAKNFPRYRTSWAHSVAMLRDRRFLDLLLHFPKHALDDETIELLSPYLAQPDFNPTSATKVSGWVAGLTTWVTSMERYWDLYKWVQPKQVKLAEQKELVEMAEARLAQAEHELRLGEEELARITSKYDESVASKTRLETDLNATLSKINAARALVAGLASEQARWTSDSQNHIRVVGRLIGNTMIASTFLGYAGPFNQQFRVKLMSAWSQELSSIGATSPPTARIIGRQPTGSHTAAADRNTVPFDDEFNLCDFLSSESEIGEWTSLQGLPVDRHSVENGLLLTRSTRFPLLIDPQGQGRKWIVQKYGATTTTTTAAVDMLVSVPALSRDLIVCPASDASLRWKLESALEHGAVLLVIDAAETLPSMLDNVVAQNWLHRGQTRTVSVHGVDVDCSREFSLILTTNHANPHFSPELSAATTLIDFTVTHLSLESQLLERVILAEKRELEEQRIDLTRNIQRYRHARVALEDELLQRLSGHHGDLLGDGGGLIGVLNQTKRTSEEMASKMRDSQQTQSTIIAAREEFRPIAVRGSILFFLTADFSRVNHMYQTSLSAFIDMFDEGVRKADDPSSVVARRVQSIVTSITAAVYSRIVRGLFRADVHTFQLLLALKAELQARRIKTSEFDLLLQGPARASSIGAAAAAAIAPNRFARWLTGDMWLGVMAMQELAAFRTLIDSFNCHESYWAEWVRTDHPEQTPLPDVALERQKSPFHRLLLVRCLRPDRTMVCAMAFIRDVLGETFVAPSQLRLDDIIRDVASPTAPIIFLLSTGADPSQEIKEAAMRWNADLHTISMGQGQEVRARAVVKQMLMREAEDVAAQPDWLLLQNAHLSIEFLLELDSTLASLSITDANRACRVWITTQPTADFPIGFLHRSIKLTAEPPLGVRHGLARQFGAISQQLLESVDRPEWHPLLFAISFLHCVVTERRKFGAIGWSHSYEFTSSDSHAAIEFAKKYLYAEDTRRPLKWETIRYMVCDIFYGGRVIDEWDRLILHAIGDQWITKDIAPNAVTAATTTHAHAHTRFEFAHGYPMPVGLQKVHEYLTFIDTLPLADPPELLGLASNADVAYRTAEAAHVLKTMRSIQPKEAGANNDATTNQSSRDTRIQARIELILAEWPNEFDMQQVELQITKMESALQKSDTAPSPPSPAPDGSALPGAAMDAPSTLSPIGGSPLPSLSPLLVCLRQEVDRMQIVLLLVRANLRDLQLALAGTILLTAESEALIDAIDLDQVPRAWEAATWRNPSSTLASWLSDLHAVSSQLSSWLRHGTPRVFSLAAFFNPRGFLTAVKQTVARDNRQWALDDMEIVATVTNMERREQVKANQDDGGGIYITGLYVDGASWDSKRHRLVDSVVGSTRRVLLPLIHVTARSSLASPHLFGHVCPVYRLAARTDENFIMSMALATDQRSAHWTRRGVAILCANG